MSACFEIAQGLYNNQGAKTIVWGGTLDIAQPLSAQTPMLDYFTMRVNTLFQVSNVGTTIDDDYVGLDQANVGDFVLFTDARMFQCIKNTTDGGSY